MATYEEKRKKGFKDVDGYGDSEELYRFCVENRLILRKVYDDYDEVLYGKDKRPVVLQGVTDSYELFKIGVKREVILMDNELPEWIKEFSIRERQYMKEITQRGVKKKKSEGKFLGGKTPYGYYMVNKKLYIDEYESFVVKFVYYRNSQSCSHNGIAKELNLRGFRNRNGNEFQAISIENILKNRRIYQGYLKNGDEEVKGEFKGILEDSEELLTEEWKNRVFSKETEERILEHRRKRHAPKDIKPYIIIGG